MHPPDIEPLYKRYFGLIEARCRRVLRDSGEAEDVAQETFVRLWKSEIASAEPAAVVAWIYRTSTRLAVDRLRHRKVIHAFRDAPRSEPEPHPTAALEARELLARVAATAPEDELQAAILCRIDGMTQPAAAESLGISERSVRRLLDRFDERIAPLRAPVEAQ